LCYLGFFTVYAVAGKIDILHLSPSQWLALPDLMRGVAPGVNALAVTVFHAGVVASQVGNAFACRTERNRGRELGWFSNPFLFLGIGVEIAIILSLIYIPFLYRIFEHIPLPPYYWILLSLFAPIIYSLDWIRKQLLRQRQAQKTGLS
jgi:P-type Ca2+ transporter type 2C